MSAYRWGIARLDQGEDSNLADGGPGRMADVPAALNASEDKAAEALSKAKRAPAGQSDPVGNGEGIIFE